MQVIPQKIQTLKYIAEQGIATLTDIQNHLNKLFYSDALRVSLYKMGVSHAPCLNISHGLWYISKQEILDSIHHYYPSLPRFKVQEIRSSEVFHALELNQIRNILEKTSLHKIVEWQSENYIRALPLSQRPGIPNQKIPDAIFFRERPDGTRQKFFLEYERTLKSTQRYADIFRFYANRDDVQNRNVLYICEGDIKVRLEQTEQFLVKTARLKAVGIYFQFMTLESFKKTYQQNKNTEVMNHEQIQQIHPFAAV